MIAVDSQPFSIVEDHGFSNLLKTIEPRYLLTSRKFFTENILPRIHTGVKLEVHSLLSSVSFFSFTTDIWSTNVNNDSLLSLTAHWLTDSSEKGLLSFMLNPLMNPIQEKTFALSLTEC